MRGARGHVGRRGGEGCIQHTVDIRARRGGQGGPDAKGVRSEAMFDFGLTQMRGTFFYVRGREVSERQPSLAEARDTVGALGRGRSREPYRKMRAGEGGGAAIESVEIHMARVLGRGLARPQGPASAHGVFQHFQRLVRLNADGFQFRDMPARTNPEIETAV